MSSRNIKNILCLLNNNHKLFSFYILLITCYLLFLPSISDAVEITGPDVTFQNNDIYITTSLLLDEKYLEEIRNGINKEIRFYIDLFRIWKIWPDEFITGKKFVKTLKCDPVKKEYVATSSDGNILIEKRFKSFETMIQWVININNLKLASIRELEIGGYFVRITVESKIRNLPPVIGYFLIFLPENEFKIEKDSPAFDIGTVK
ncbi:MAG: DUF4390 domain-containing protein [Nitrospirota bacterium]